MSLAAARGRPGDRKSAGGGESRGRAGAAGRPEVRGWLWVPASGRSGAAWEVSAILAFPAMATRAGAGAAVAGAAVVAVLSAALVLYGPPLDAGTPPRAAGPSGRRRSGAGVARSRGSWVHLGRGQPRDPEAPGQALAAE